MPQSQEKEKWINWGCRLLMVFGVYQLVSGYIYWYQTRRQLISPLIPRETVDQVLEDSHVFEASFFVAIFFLAGLLCYTFSKKIVALVLLAFSALGYEIITHLL